MPTRTAILPSIAFIAIFVSVSASASWRPNGIPAAPSDSPQLNPVILSDGTGGAYVAFEGSDRLYTWAQRLGADGNVSPGWPLIGLRLPTRWSDPGYTRAHAAMIPDAEGGAIVVDDPLDYGSGVTLNRLRPNGELIWPSGILLGGLNGLYTSDHDSAIEHSASPRFGDWLPRISPNGAGGALVAWMQSTPCCEYLRIVNINPDGTQRWGSAGLGLYRHGYFPDACSDGAGGAYIAWVGYGGEATRLDVFALHLLSDGSVDPRWPASGLPVGAAPGSQHHLTLVRDGSSGCFLFWQDERAGTPQTYGSHVLSDGSVAPGWAADGSPVSSATSSPGIWRDARRITSIGSFSAIEDGAGGAYLCWTDRRSGGADVYALRVRGEGGPAAGWLENGTPVCRAIGDQERPTLASDGAGGIYVTWQDARSVELDIYVQRLTAGGARVEGWAEDGFAICAATGNQRTPVITASSDGSAIVSWTDERGPVPQVYVHRFSPDALVPVLASLVRADANDGIVRIEWRAASPWADLSIFRAESEGAYRAIGQTRSNGDGRVHFEDHDVLPGKTYRYRVGDSADPDLASGEASVTVPVLRVFAFAGLAPHPARSNRIGLDLIVPSAGTVRLEAFDVAGRRATAVELAVDAGRQIVRLAPSPELRPGIWLLRLTWNSTTITRRVCVTE